MNKLNNKSGFTLIEIIVVLIIIGILAAIALPNLFNNVQTSQGGSALQTAASMETPIESCVNKNASTPPGTVPCDFDGGAANDGDIVSNGTGLTTASAGNNFTISVGSISGNASGGNLTYTLEGKDVGGVVAFDLLRNTAGIFSCTHGASPYQNVC